MNDGTLACDLAWQFPYSVQAAIGRYVMSRVIGNSSADGTDLPHKMTHCESSQKSQL